MPTPHSATRERLAPIVLAAGLFLVAPPAANGVALRSTALDITPDGQELWVVNPDHGTVSVIATQGVGENTVLAEIAVGRDPWCVDIHPTNGEVWVGSHRDDEITIIDAATRTVLTSIATGYETFGVAFSPDGTKAMVTATGADMVQEIDVATRTVSRSVGVYRRPRGIAWAPDGSKAWVSHLLTPSYFGRLTEVDAATWTASEILLRQVFGTNQAGYPSAMQNISLAPAPADSMLWIPANLINSAKGALSGIPFTFTNVFHAVVRPVNVNTAEDLNWQTYFLSEGGTPDSGYAGGTTSVAGPVAVDFQGGRAYVANMQSNDVTVLSADILQPAELLNFAAGKAPIGVVTHPTLNRVYVANWLSRDVTVFDSGTNTVVATVSTVANEVLHPNVLNGKQLFFTSTGRMSFQNRNSCGGCHVFGRPDARIWDLSQFGGRDLRATRDWRGSGWTAPYGWTSSMDEIQDNEWTTLVLMGGAGLITGTPNLFLGAPNDGLSRDLDDLAMFIAVQKHRPDTPYRNPDGTLTAAALAGEVLFNDPLVGCVVCHTPPFYDDGSLPAPFLLHDVGTGDPTDATTAGGLDTPSLVGVWDGAPYLHNHRALTITDVLTTFNAADQHGVTSHLTPQQIADLAVFVNSIGWPAGIPDPVAAPEVTPAHTLTLESFPNPFSAQTSLRFQVPNATSEVRLEIFDVNGRRVGTALNQPMTRGAHTVGWDTRDDQGRPVTAGVYFARLVVNGQPAGSKKMTVLR